MFHDTRDAGSDKGQNPRHPGDHAMDPLRSARAGEAFSGLSDRFATHLGPVAYMVGKLLLLITASICMKYSKPSGAGWRKNTNSVAPSGNVEKPKAMRIRGFAERSHNGAFRIAFACCRILKRACHAPSLFAQAAIKRRINHAYQNFVHTLDLRTPHLYRHSALRAAIDELLRQLGAEPRTRHRFLYHLSIDERRGHEPFRRPTRSAPRH